MPVHIPECQDWPEPFVHPGERNMQTAINKNEQYWTEMSQSQSQWCADILPLLCRVCRALRPLLGLPADKKKVSSQNFTHNTFWTKHGRTLNLQFHLSGQLGLCPPATKKVKRLRAAYKSRANGDKHRQPQLTRTPTAPGIPGTPWRTDKDRARTRMRTDKTVAGLQ